MITRFVCLCLSLEKGPHKVALTDFELNYVDQTDLKLRNTPASDSASLGLQVCTIVPSLIKPVLFI